MPCQDHPQLSPPAWRNVRYAPHLWHFVNFKTGFQFSIFSENSEESDPSESSEASLSSEVLEQDEKEGDRLGTWFGIANLYNNFAEIPNLVFHKNILKMWIFRCQNIWKVVCFTVP